MFSSPQTFANYVQHAQISIVYLSFLLSVWTLKIPSFEQLVLMKFATFYYFPDICLGESLGFFWIHLLQ